MSHLERNDLLPNTQCAYIKVKSTTFAVQIVVNFVITGIDNRFKSTGLFYELKVFDMIASALLRP